MKIKLVGGVSFVFCSFHCSGDLDPVDTCSGIQQNDSVYIAAVWMDLPNGVWARYLCSMS